jgi:5,10-methylenetetrahydromethanopterin reductase
LGVTKDDFTPIERAIMTERDPDKARALVTEKMLRIGIVGTAGDLVARLETLVAMGARHLSFGPPLGPDPLAAVEQIGQAVIPHFRRP